MLQRVIRSWVMIWHIIIKLFIILITYKFDSHSFKHRKFGRDFSGTKTHFMKDIRKRISSSIKNSYSKDITGNVTRTRTHGEKWSGCFKTKVARGDRRWRGWKGSGRVDACIDYRFSPAGRRENMEKEKGARKKANASPAPFRISRISKKFASCTPIFFAYSYTLIFLSFIS